MRGLTSALLETSAKSFFPLLPYNGETDRVCRLDLSADNKQLDASVFNDTESFSRFISHSLESRKCRYGFGGYNELRGIYSRSEVFDSLQQQEPRRLHLGIDIWGAAGTAIYAFMQGKIHSFAFNDRFGDYGVTLILQHQLQDCTFYTLYGHLSLADMDQWEEGTVVEAGQLLAHFGLPAENGHWPPHLHFQLIQDMEGYKGDYPGVCRYSEKQHYLNNCPDPWPVLAACFDNVVIE